MTKGKLEVIVGCMSSGKSEVMIHRLTRAKIARQIVQVFKPAVDTRTDEKTVASRSGASCDAVTVSGSKEILDKVDCGTQVVGIDEVHFFDEELPDVIKVLVIQGRRVIVAGLNTDFRGEPFGTVVPHLMAIADEVTSLKAVCKRCGGDAVRTQMLVEPPEDGSNVQVGGDESYEARCRKCHTVK